MMPLPGAHPPLGFDASGTPFSTLYGDVFRSRSGAWAEAREVFIEGCRLPERWREDGAGVASFTILELGFGLGVNFLATLQAWREHGAPGARLHYVSIEGHPLAPGDLAHGLHALDAPPGDARQLVDQWPAALPGLHALDFEDGRVALTLCLGDAGALLPRLQLGADAFFLDGFSPARNPAMWQPQLLRGLARLARPGATIATWSAAAAVREALQAGGFAMERIAGHAGKRHRLRGRHAPQWRSFPAPPSPPQWAERTVLVVGAGLAGAAVAAGFARRGWRVSVLESAMQAGTGGSGQPLCADHLHLSADDNQLARLTRAALSWRTRERSPGAPGPLGKLMIDADPRQAAHRLAMLARLDLPRSYAQHLAQDEASDLAGLRLPHGGLWLPACDAVEPAALIGGWLGSSAAIRLHTGAAVAGLQRDDSGWVALDGSGQALARGALAVLANAGDAPRLARLALLPMRRVRGQSTLLPRERVGMLRVLLSGSAYAAPLDDSILCGASFDDGDSLQASSAVDQGNLERLANMLGTDARAWRGCGRTAAVGYRYALRDHLPAIGALHDEPACLREAAALLRNDRLALPRVDTLYGAFGFGSRGLLWATLAARLLPALAEGDPLPLEADLARAVDPGRFIRRMLRRQRALAAPALSPPAAAASGP